MNDQMISGKWMNKFTGQVIYVRDSVIDGDQMVIITGNGTLTMDEFANNYIQASDDIYDEKGNIISNAVMDFSEICETKPKTGNVKLFNDESNINENFVRIESYNSNTYDATPLFINTGYTVSATTLDVSIINEQDLYEVNENYKLIDKLFNKVNFIPKININIESENFPKEQLKMLVDIYDITEQEIADYIRLNYLSEDILNESISQCIKKELN